MTAPVVTRPAKVTYGTFEVGGTTNYQIHGLTVLEKDYEQARLVFDVLVQETTASTFMTRCTALETAYRAKNKPLTVDLGSNTWISLEPALNTGFLSEATCRKVGSPADSDNSRLYRCEVRMQLPADETGKSGRRSASINVVTGATGVRALSVDAVYTALGSNEALAQAQSAFPTYVASLKTSLGGDWDTSPAVAYDRDSDNKLCRASAVYRELIYDQSTSETDSAALVGLQVSVTTGRSSADSDQGSGASALLGIFVEFTTGVVYTESQDLQNVYEGTVRAHVISIARANVTSSVLALIRENVSFDPTSNTISGKLELLGTGTNSLIYAQTSISVLEVPPDFYVPVANGDPYARDHHTGPAHSGVQVTADVSELASGRSSREFQPVERYVAKLVRSGYVVTRTRSGGALRLVPLRVVP